jgi:hypothetical protein
VFKVYIGIFDLQLNQEKKGVYLPYFSAKSTDDKLYILVIGKGKRC